MQRISVNDKTVRYVKNPKDIKKYLPNQEIKSMKLYGKDRVFTYDDGREFKIEFTNKVIGTGSGDICQICESGELQDMGGCYTCNNCGAQLKCGL